MIHACASRHPEQVASKLVCMPTDTGYSVEQPPRESITALPGAVVLEFGTNWCGYCSAAQPLIAQAMAGRPGIRHIRIEDGPGRMLGRSYRVKLWPTLIFLRDGEELARVVRPLGTGAIQAALDRVDD
jgi:thioredoxin 1